jgi:chromosome segregation ATPase
MIAQLQDDRDQLRGLSKAGKDHIPPENEALEKELDREKALRLETERRLRDITIEFKNYKAKETSKTSSSALERVWKTDLIALQTKLDEFTQQKVKLMNEKANLQTELQGNEVIILKLKEEIRATANKYKELEGKQAEEMAELRLAQRELVKLKREKEELEWKSVSIERNSSHFEAEELLAMRQKVLFLESEMVKLQCERDNLLLELHSRPTQKQLKFKETELQSLLHASPAVSPKASTGTLEDVMAVLGVSRSAEVITRVLSLQKTNKSAQRLIGRLSALIKDCSPGEMHSKPPSNKEIWRWTRRIAEDYMRLAREQSHLSSLKAVIEQCCKVLCCEDDKTVAKAVEKLVEEAKVLTKLVEMLRNKLNIGPRVSIEELMQHLVSQ